MPAREDGDRQQADDAPLTDDDLGQLGFEIGRALAPAREVDRVEIPDRLHAFAGTREHSCAWRPDRGPATEIMTRASEDGWGAAAAAPRFLGRKQF